MAAKKEAVDTAIYVCREVCRYKDVTYAVGDEVEMGAREAEFLVNAGKFTKKLSDKEAKAQADAQAKAESEAKAQADAQVKADAQAKTNTDKPDAGGAA